MIAPICPCCGKRKRPEIPQGLGTSLKPAMEPIAILRKPLSEKSVAANVLKWGTGALNIDATRIDGEKGIPSSLSNAGGMGWTTGGDMARKSEQNGRWPANLCHDGSEEVLAGFPASDSGATALSTHSASMGYGGSKGAFDTLRSHGDSGSAARFFYTAKVSASERDGCSHPTMKPVDLMRWLCRLVTPKGGTILDPFLGSGSTMIAADCEQFHGIGCELSPEYAAIAERRIRASAGLFAEIAA